MNHNDTLGKRIQTYRKAAGLSQEALGEQLQVSRQAVSKWESDITVPELDSLIAMSRLFGVSVGELLGVETKAADSGTQQSEACETGEADPERESPSPGLTEKELAAVEAIAARYAREAEQHRSQRWSKKKKRVVIAFACLLVLAVGWYVKEQLESINQRFNQLQHEINSIDSNVSNQVYSMGQQIEDILSKQANILADSNVSLLAADIKRETVTLQISISPKEWTETTTAVFTVMADGEQFTSDPAEGKGGVFTSEGLTVPMSQEIALTVTLLDGGAARTEKLESIYYCQPESFRLEVYHVTWDSTRYTNGTVVLNDLSLGINLPYANGIGQVVQVTRGELQLYRNYAAEPEQVVEIPMLLNTQAVQASYINLDSIADEHKATFTLDDHDTMLAVLMLTDNYDRTTYTIIEGFRRQGSAVNDIPTIEGLPWTPGAAIPE